MQNTILRALVKFAATRGQFFTVTFIKADGTVRTMNCRTGVTKYLKGTGKAHSSGSNVTVYDVQAKGYRTIPLDRVIAVRVKGTEAAATA